MPRVVAGKAKGAPLSTLKGDHTRPSSSRLKEAVFSILGRSIEESRFLDLFAGSGQMGLEAASRGAREVVLVEKHYAAFQVLRKNLAATRLEHVCHPVKGDAFKALKQAAEAGERFDFIYFDPPWNEEEEAFDRLTPLAEKVLEDEGCLIVESEKETEWPEVHGGLKRVRACHYGRAMVLFYRKTGLNAPFEA